MSNSRISKALSLLNIKRNTFNKDYITINEVTKEEDLQNLIEFIKYHLTNNFTPPIPDYMVQPCIDAVEAFKDGEKDRAISTPNSLYRGKHYAPAYVIIEAHKLDQWLEDDLDTK